MFKEGNLIRPITRDGSGEIVLVLEYDEDSGTVHVAVGNDDGDSWEDADDYELVTDTATEQEVTPIIPFTPNRTSEEIHDDIQRMMVQLAQYYQAAELSEALTMTFEATVYGSDTDLTLKCKADLGYGTSVVTRDLNKSVKIAVDRMRENKALEPLEITFEGKQVA